MAKALLRRRRRLPPASALRRRPRRPFSDYSRAPKAQRQAVLERFARSMLARSSANVNEYATAKPRLMPIVRSASETAQAGLQTSLVAGSTVDPADLPVNRPLTGDLTVGLAIDSQDSISRISARQLEKFGVDFDQALQDALLNLRGLPERGGWKQVGTGLWSGEWGDDYESSRLLLPDLIHRLNLADPVACLPTRNALLVTSAGNLPGLTEMARIARRAVESQPRWLSALPYQLLGDRWSVFQPPAECAQLFVEVATIVRAGIYNEQKRILEQLHERDRVDVFVATAMLAKNPAGTLIDATTWTEGVDSLLPETKLLFLVRPAAQAAALAIPWADAFPLLTELLEKQELTPVRYRARGFPDEALLKRLSALAG